MSDWEGVINAGLDFAAGTSNMLADEIDRRQRRRAEVEYQSALTKARRELDQFNTESIENNPDYKQYGTAWQEQRQQIYQRVTQDLETGEAQRMFDMAWQDMEEQQRQFVVDAHNKRETVDLQVQTDQNLQDAVQRPDFATAVESVNSIVERSVENGTYDRRQAYQRREAAYADLQARAQNEVERSLKTNQFDAAQEALDAARNAGVVGEKFYRDQSARVSYQRTVSDTMTRAREMGPLAGREWVMNAENTPNVRAEDRQQIGDMLMNEWAQDLRVQRERQRIADERAYERASQSFYDNDLTIEGIYNSDRYAGMTAQHKRFWADRLLAMSEADARGGAGGGDESRKERAEAEVASMINRRVAHSEIDSTIHMYMQDGIFDGDDMRQWFGENDQANPSALLQDAQARIDTALENEAVSPNQANTVRKEMERYIRSLEINEEGEYQGPVDHDEVMQVLENKIAPYAENRVGAAIGGFLTGTDSSDRIRNAMQGGELRGTLDPDSIFQIADAAEGFDEATARNLLSGNMDYEDLPDRRKQIVDNNLRVAQLIRTQRSSFESDFGTRPVRSDISEGKHVVFQHSNGSWWRRYKQDDGRVVWQRSVGQNGQFEQWVDDTPPGAESSESQPTEADDFDVQDIDTETAGQSTWGGF